VERLSVGSDYFNSVRHIGRAFFTVLKSGKLENTTGPFKRKNKRRIPGRNSRCII